MNPRQKVEGFAVLTFLPGPPYSIHARIVDKEREKLMTKVGTGILLQEETNMGRPGAKPIRYTFTLPPVLETGFCTWMVSCPLGLEYFLVDSSGKDRLKFGMPAPPPQGLFPSVETPL